MSVGSPDTAQTMQRIYVGLTGLAVVTVLIVLASAVVAWRANDMPVSAVGASNSAVVANMTAPGNSLGEKTKEEPLAELGAAPSTTSTEKVDAAAIARRQQEAQQNGEAR
jgi:predicted metal-binding membrane protein